MYSGKDNRVLRGARLERGLSQSELARRAGISRQALSAIEAGTYHPSVTVALNLARELGRTVESLFGAIQPVAINARLRTLDRAQARAGVHVALGRVGGKVIAISRELAGLRLKPADGIVEKLGRNGSADVTALRSAEEIDATLLVAGCDPSVAVLDSWLRRSTPAVTVEPIACSSLLALAALANREVHASGIHLRDPSSGEYNLTAAREALKRQALIVVNFARWELGLACAPANPLSIRSIADFAERPIRIVNRQAGSGARLALDEMLAERGIPAASIKGYQTMAAGHLEVAEAIAHGRADAGLTLRVAALAFDLSFIPLREERYDLVVPRVEAQRRPVVALMEALTSSRFANELRTLCHYDTARTGDIIAHAH